MLENRVIFLQARWLERVLADEHDRSRTQTGSNFSTKRANGVKKAAPNSGLYWRRKAKNEAERQGITAGP